MSAAQIVMLLLDLALILVAAGVFGWLARRLGQPPVVGEIVAGILFGPTLLHGAIARDLFPTDVRPLLSALANVGVALFMFGVGMDLDHRALRGHGRATVSVAVAAIVVPFGLGVAAAQLLAAHQPPGQRLGFTLFVGAAMSVTAFPVLARILHDRRMADTDLGRMALASAAIDDVLAWCLLAVVVALTGGSAGALWRLPLLVPFGALVLVAGRPLLRRVLRPEMSGRVRFAIVLAGLLASGAFTEWLGLDFIFGAFLFGVAIPRDDVEPTAEPTTGLNGVTIAGPNNGMTAGTPLRADLKRALDRICGVLLLPVYFVVAGLQVDLSHIGASGLLDLGLIMLVAVGGKFGSAYVAARLHGIRPRPATGLAALMNTRGLTELVILTVGLDLGVLDRSLYSLLVVMAVVTTALTGPVLHLVRPRPEPAEQLEAATH